MRVKKIHLSPMRVYARLRFYKRSQYWDRETIARYQFQRVRSVLLHAASNVPYYRDLFKSIRFDPDKFRSLRDLAHIPLLDKENIRQNLHQFIADHKQSVSGYWKYTSGSTGKPLKLFIDRNCHIHKYAATLRAYHWAGYAPGRRAFLLVEPDGLKRDFGYRPISNSIFFDSRTLTRENVLKFYRLLNRFRPVYFIGYGRAFLHLYKHLVELGLKIPSPKSMIHYGENLSENDRLRLEEIYQAKVYDFYSHREDVVIAADIEPGKKLLMEDYFYPELLDHTGRNIDEGTGELVGTGFHNYVMPLIRYKTNDILTIGRFQERQRQQFSVVKEIQGRVNDKVITPGGREFYFLGDPLFDVPGIISAQFIQDYVDQLKINLITDNQFSTESIERLKSSFRDYIGEPMNFEVQIVDKLEERGSGKRPVIISRLDPTGMYLNHAPQARSAEE